MQDARKNFKAFLLSNLLTDLNISLKLWLVKKKATSAQGADSFFCHLDMWDLKNLLLRNCWLDLKIIWSKYSWCYCLYNLWNLCNLFNNKHVYIVKYVQKTLFSLYAYMQIFFFFKDLTRKIKKSSSQKPEVIYCSIKWSRSIKLYNLVM